MSSERGRGRLAARVVLVEQRLRGSAGSRAHTPTAAVGTAMASEAATRSPRAGERPRHQQRAGQRPDAEAEVQAVQRGAVRAAPPPDEQGVAADVGAAGAQAHQDEQRAHHHQARHVRDGQERRGHQQQRSAQHPVAEAAVVEVAAEQRADEVAERLHGEQHADGAERRAGLVLQLGQGRTEEAEAQTEGDEAGQVDEDRADATDPARPGPVGPRATEGTEPRVVALRLDQGAGSEVSQAPG